MLLAILVLGCGIRYSYSDNYYATDGEDRGCSSIDGSTSFNASIVAADHYFLLNGYN